MKKKKSTEKSVRIQTSVLNGVEKKALLWLAERQPKWVNSDTLTFIGFIGSVIIAAGYILSNYNINFLWLASLGLVINWYGDSLDGTLARFRKQQRPVYGFYLDHTMDAINETFMFMGVGLSPFMRFDLSCILLAIYLMLTLNVSMNAHLKGEFRLTYAKLGPTEFRLIAIIVNAILVFDKPLNTWSYELPWLSSTLEFHALDIVGIAILIILVLIYIVTITQDLRYYSKVDPRPKNE
ncbi:MAG: CDP-alcohol phosphatidyltransferase family protein [Bacteroidales bacterium]|nr:CDP-alcohol phosphatidyltransferase family protein [Bacteroidales bacterium]